jgi:hypothetical protein
VSEGLKQKAEKLLQLFVAGSFSGYSLPDIERAEDFMMECKRFVDSFPVDLSKITSTVAWSFSRTLSKDESHLVLGFPSFYRGALEDFDSKLAKALSKAHLESIKAMGEKWEFFDSWRSLLHALLILSDHIEDLDKQLKEEG